MGAFENGKNKIYYYIYQSSTLLGFFFFLFSETFQSSSLYIILPKSQHLSTNLAAPFYLSNLPVPSNLMQKEKKGFPLIGKGNILFCNFVLALNIPLVPLHYITKSEIRGYHIRISQYDMYDVCMVGELTKILILNALRQKKKDVGP